MIKIIFFDKGIDVEGHANFSLKGNDIVCAAVSGIFLTGINWFNPNVVNIRKDLKKNKISFRIEKISKENKVALDVIKFQLSSIAEEYPKIITVIKDER